MPMKLIVTFVLMFFAPAAHAGLELGGGTTSSTSGRLVPALSGAVTFGEWAVTGTSTGTRTNVYYLSAYTMGAVKRWPAGKFWWAEMVLGFGGGVAYSQYGYRNTPTDTMETKADFTAGPLIQFRWEFLGPLYVGLDALFGIKYPTGVLALALQDVVSLTLGLSL